MFVYIFFFSFMFFLTFFCFLLSLLLVGSLWLPSLVLIVFSLFSTSFSPTLKILFFYISI